MNVINTLKLILKIDVVAMLSQQTGTGVQYVHCKINSHIGK